MTKDYNLGYYIEPKLMEKIQLMKKRREKKFDHLILVDGEEGFGKTNWGSHFCHATSKVIGIPYTNKNIFFDPDKLMDFAANTEGQIIHWDEAAFGAMSTQWQNKVQQKLIQCLMVARKKRHIWVFLIPYLDTLKTYFLRRCVGIVHVYSRDDIERGRYVYINKKKKYVILNQVQQRRQQISFKKYSFRGSCNWVLPKLINEDLYESEKDEAIKKAFSEDNGTNDTNKDKYILEHYRFALLASELKERTGMSNRAIANWFDVRHNIKINHMHISRGLKLVDKYPNLIQNQAIP